MCSPRGQATDAPRQPALAMCSGNKSCSNRNRQGGDSGHLTDGRPPQKSCSGWVRNLYESKSLLSFSICSLSASPAGIS